MKVAIRMTEDEELKALPVLLKHSPGMMLHNGTYLLGADAVRSLREAGVRFVELSRESGTANQERVGSGERI